MIIFDAFVQLCLVFLGALSFWDFLDNLQQGDISKVWGCLLSAFLFFGGMYGLYRITYLTP